jgi:hypothetical protein
MNTCSSCSDCVRFAALSWSSRVSSWRGVIELRFLAACVLPLARAEAGQHAQLNSGSTPSALVSSIAGASSAGFSMTMNTRRPELAPDQREAQVLAILKPLQMTMPPRRAERQHGHQFRLRTGLRPKPARPTAASSPATPSAD